MTASMLGLGAVLATSAAIFTVLRWVGGAYLVYLGIKLWRARRSSPSTRRRQRRPIPAACSLMPMPSPR